MIFSLLVAAIRLNILGLKSIGELNYKTFINKVSFTSCKVLFFIIITYHNYECLQERKSYLKRNRELGDILISTEHLIEIITKLHMEFTMLTRMKIPIEILPSFAVNLSDKQLQMRLDHYFTKKHCKLDRLFQILKVNE